MLQGEHSAILSTFIKLPFVISIFVLSIFVWLFYTVQMAQSLLIEQDAATFLCGSLLLYGNNSTLSHLLSSNNQEIEYYFTLLGHYNHRFTNQFLY